MTKRLKPGVEVKVYYLGNIVVGTVVRKHPVVKGWWTIKTPDSVEHFHLSVIEIMEKK